MEGNEMGASTKFLVFPGGVGAEQNDGDRDEEKDVLMGLNSL